MGFYIDLKKISIREYKEMLKKSDLLPSRLVLKEDIEQNFERIAQQKVHNLEELLNILKNKINFKTFLPKVAYLRII